MKVFSFSRLSLYETCPHRFYKKYVEKYEEPTTLPLALGKAVHKAIEEKMKGLSHDQAVVQGLIEAEFHSEVTRDDISDLVSRAPTNKFKGELETHFKLRLSDEKNSPMIQGFIDVITTHGQIVDWKTNRVPYDVRDNKQVALYAWAVNKLRGLNYVRGSLFFLRFRRESSFTFTQREMESARKWAYTLAKEIQSKLNLLKSMPILKDDLFPDKPSSYCSHCPFAVECFKSFSPYAMSEDVVKRRRL